MKKYCFLEKHYVFEQKIEEDLENDVRLTRQGFLEKSRFNEQTDRPPGKSEVFDKQRSS